MMHIAKPKPQKTRTKEKKRKMSTPNPKTGISCPESNGYFDWMDRDSMFKIPERWRLCKFEGSKDILLFADLNAAFSTITLRCDTDVMRMMSKGASSHDYQNAALINSIALKYYKEKETSWCLNQLSYLKSLKYIYERSNMIDRDLVCFHIT
jgi:hypothetical protein